MESEVQYEAKKLYLKMKENESRYVSGEVDLMPLLKETDDIYNRTLKIEGVSAKHVAMDAQILELQSSIVQRTARKIEINTLVFDPVKFSENLRKFYRNDTNDEQRSGENRKNDESLWTNLGQEAQLIFNSVPSFDYIYGLFDANPIEVLKQKRKRLEKDKIGDVTRPDTSDADSTKCSNKMLKDAEGIMSVFIKYCKKNKVDSIGYYKFVINPESFTKSVENIFIVSLLIKESCLCILEDEKGLPILKKCTAGMNANWSHPSVQTIVSLSYEEWEELVKVLHLKEPIISRN